VESETGIEVQVVDWNTGAREVAIHFKDLGQLLTLDAEGARSLAFLLMECADFIEPPFDSERPTPSEPESFDSESEDSFFGPYDDEEDDDYEDDDEEP
jgi:hypothetical protein